MNRIYKVLLLVATTLSLCSCSTSTRLIGEVNMISNRNINTSFDYQQLSAYSGGSKRQLKKTKCLNIHDAVNQTVKSVPGGEFLMNAKIYYVNNKYYAVEGDVWGRAINSNGYQGYKIGDFVMWKSGFNIIKKGKIIAIKDSENCIIEDENSKKHTVEYSKLMHAESSNENPQEEPSAE